MVGEPTNDSLRVGWIPYWNLLPLRQELGKRQPNWQMLPGHPSQINRQLSQGEIELAPCSSVCLIKNIRHEMAVPVGVASSGSVHSVYLGLSSDLSCTIDPFKRRVKALQTLNQTALERYGERKRLAAQYVWKHLEELPAMDIEHAPHLRLTANSASSATLARLFYRFIFGKKAFENASTTANKSRDAELKGSMELLIGDEALIRRNEFSKVIDLGQLWQQLTGLPFVFAVWQKTGALLDPTAMQKISEAAEIAQTKMRVEPTAYWDQALPLKTDGTEVDLAGYWKHIHYRLQPDDISGLLYFLCLVRPLLRAEIDDAMVVKMLRWQQMGDSRQMTI